jgi:hypothetical protein
MCRPFEAHPQPQVNPKEKYRILKLTQSRIKFNFSVQIRINCERKPGLDKDIDNEFLLLSYNTL